MKNHKINKNWTFWVKWYNYMMKNKNNKKTKNIKLNCLFIVTTEPFVSYLTED
jgi:hypothetical protein